MISYIQTKLQKHNKLFFFTLLAVIIVAFVFTIGEAPGLGGGQRTEENKFFGYNLNSERDVRELTRTGQLSYRIANGNQFPEGDRFQSFVLERIALLGLAEELEIPGPTEDQLRDFLSSRQAFLDEQGRFDPQKYANFIDEIEANPQASTGDVALIIDQDFRIEKARELVSGPGYVLPSEVRMQLEREQTLWSLDLAKLNLAEFNPEIEISDEVLEEFFEENDFRYEREPRVSFSYALFEQEAFLDQVGELSDEDIQDHFEQDRETFVAMKAEDEAPAEGEKNEENEETSEETEVTLADVRQEVEDSLRRQKARRLAGSAAADFAYALFRQQEARPGTEEFEELLAEYDGQLRDAPPATESEFPAQLGFPRDVQQKVFRLNEDRDFSDPLALNDNYIVLIYEETLPAFIPPMEEVRPAVERDYRSQERRRLISEKGEELREKIRTRMEEGASFVEAAEAEGLDTESAESFTRRSPPEEINQQLVARLDEFKLEEVSAMIPQQNVGYFVYVTDREVPEIDQTSDEFVGTTDQLRSFSSMVNQRGILDEYSRLQHRAGSN